MRDSVRYGLQRTHLNARNGMSWETVDSSMIVQREHYAVRNPVDVWVLRLQPIHAEYNCMDQIIHNTCNYKHADIAHHKDGIDNVCTFDDSTISKRDVHARSR